MGGPGGPESWSTGTWPSGAPWAGITGTWTDCSTTLATGTGSSAVSVVTTTINGQVVTGTTFAGQAVQTGSAGDVSSARAVGAFGALAAAILGAAVAL